MPPLNTEQVPPTATTPTNVVLPPAPSVPAGQISTTQIPIGKHHWKLFVTVGLLLVITIGFFVWKGSGILMSSSKPAIQHCSRYFDICVQDPAKKWNVVTDSLHDFDLVDKTTGITLALAYSTTLQFSNSKPGFASVTLLGQNTNAYKDNSKDLTRIITGANKIGSGNLIVLVSSANDISAEKLTEIVGAISQQTK